MSSIFTLPAEWYPQDAILITWPHENSAWAQQLEQVSETYFDLICKLSHYQSVIIQLDPTINLEKLLHQLEVRNADLSHCHLVQVRSNDTWARDHGPICLVSEDAVKVLSFNFNGWGNKFPAELDNQLNHSLQAAGVFSELDAIDWVLEGGSIESDGNGTLMTTGQCNLNPNRNGKVTQASVDKKLKNWLGAKQILWLQHGALAGDDTDAHIDTLARFAPNRTIIYQGCQRPADSHFVELSAMKTELEHATDIDGEPYQLVELPLPEAKYAADGHRLPATYANFLITDKLVLVPTYQDINDSTALARVQGAFTEHMVVGIDALPLIEEHGSLHCITMQLPRGSVNFAAQWLSI